MAKRDTGITRTQSASTSTDASGATPTADAIEQGVVAFAEQLGRLVGTVQAKAEGWLDRDALNRQIAGVRDGAADLLEQLGGKAAKAPEKKAAPKKLVGAKAGAARGRSGGVVDAPGKKHRKPVPSDRVPDAVSRTARMRTAKTTVKTSRSRGRG